MRIGEIYLSKPSTRVLLIWLLMACCISQYAVATNSLCLDRGGDPTDLNQCLCPSGKVINPFAETCLIKQIDVTNHLNKNLQCLPLDLPTSFNLGGIDHEKFCKKPSQFFCSPHNPMHKEFGNLIRFQKSLPNIITERLKKLERKNNYAEKSSQAALFSNYFLQTDLIKEFKINQQISIDYYKSLQKIGAHQAESLRKISLKPIGINYRSPHASASAAKIGLGFLTTLANRKGIVDFVLFHELAHHTGMNLIHQPSNKKIEGMEKNKSFQISETQFLQTQMSSHLTSRLECFSKTNRAQKIDIDCIAKVKVNVAAMRFTDYAKTELRGIESILKRQRSLYPDRQDFTTFSQIFPCYDVTKKKTISQDLACLNPIFLHKKKEAIAKISQIEKKFKTNSFISYKSQLLFPFSEGVKMCQNGTFEEVNADHVAVDLYFFKNLKTKTKKSMVFEIAEVATYLGCDYSTPKDRLKHEKSDSHATGANRIDQIIFSHPEVRSLFGCPPPSIGYCTGP